MSLISVIVPCYKQAQYLDECLQSVLDQTFTNWECIIVNDGSPDNTEEIAKKWLEKDLRFKYLYKENGGLSSARNAGINLAKGEWIQLLDCDDIIDLEKFEKSNVFFDSCDLVLGNFQMIYDANLKPPFCDITKHPITLKTLIMQWDIDFNIPIHCAIFKKNKIEKIKFNEDLKAKEDWVFWITLFSKEIINYQLINKPLAFYRYNNEGLSKNANVIFENIYFANNFIYENNNLEIKELMFLRLNETVFKISNDSFRKQNYIDQLKKTKVLKYYLFLKTALLNIQNKFHFEHK